jgi:putative oxidoreductase
MQNRVHSSIAEGDGTTSPRPVSTIAGDLARLVLRLWLGAMMIAHGWGKVFGGMERFTGGVEKMGFPAPEVFAWAAALTEVVGGAFLIFGFATRPTSVFVAITMLVAALIRHAPDPWAKKELPLTFLVMALVLLLIGAGRYSIDALLARARRPRRAG